MPEDQPPKRALITPPPGLLPEAPREELEGTDSGTRRISRDAPAFFPRGVGSAPPRPEPAPPAGQTATDGPTVDRRVVWAVRTPEGARHPVPIRGLVVGRNPAAPEGWDGAALLGVLDPEKTVSKTHAGLRIDAGELIIVDLDSTNGTTVGVPDAPELAVDTANGTRVPPGATLRLGSYTLDVARD